MKRWPALDVRMVSGPDHVLAAVDDFSPTAAEERGETLRVFFGSASARDAAAHALGSLAAPVDVDDEDWALRSQSSLTPITVGRITVVPDPSAQIPETPALFTDPLPGLETHLSIVIRPSMGFGTGHHATTRLCLAALQAIELDGASVLDVGTGSGILAIAASRLGADRALGLDSDPVAIDSANENLTLNRGVGNVRFEVADLADMPLPPADIVLANLTGAMLVREAAALMAAVKPSGVLIVSGILDHEEDAVRQAFGGADLRHRGQDDEWVGLTFNRGVSWTV